MGNKSDKYINYHITQDKVSKELPEEKANLLYNTYRLYIDPQAESMTKQFFERLLQIPDSTVTDLLFDIFSSKKDKMSFPDFQVFYTAFVSNDINVKFALFCFLFFRKKVKISKNEYLDSINKFTNLNQKFDIFVNPNFFQDIIVKEDKSYFQMWMTYNNATPKNDLVIYKRTFMEKSSKIESHIKFYKNIFLHKKIINSSDLLSFSVDNMIKNHFMYVCDCLLEGSKIVDQNEKEIEVAMRPSFLSMTKNTNSHLYFKNFNDILKEMRISEKLMKLVIKFLEKYTMKDYMNFEDFKYFILNTIFTVAYKKKKEFLFKMILLIANCKNEIKMKNLINILGVDTKELNKDKEDKIDLNEVINEKGFHEIKNEIVKNEIESFINDMENLGLLPYYKFNVNPRDIKISQKIVKFILNNKTADEYLELNFDICNKFYPIEIGFWNQLIAPEEIQNSMITNVKIADNDIVLNFKKDEPPKQEENNTNNKKDDTKEKEKKTSNNPTTNNNTGENKNEQNNTNTNNNNNSNNPNNKEDQNKQVPPPAIPKPKNKTKGKLKPSMKYGEDFILVCGELYKSIKAGFEFDYKITLKKTQKFTPLSETPSTISTSSSSTVTPESQVLIKNISEGFLSKSISIEKHNLEYIVDFYPVKILEIGLGALVRYLEKEKIQLDEKKEQERVAKLPKEEQEKIRKQKIKAENALERKKQKYYDQKAELDIAFQNQEIDSGEYRRVLEKIKEEFKEIFPKPEKKYNDYSTDMTMEEFTDVLEIKIKDLVAIKKKSIAKCERIKTNEEICDELIKNNKGLTLDNFLTYYFQLNEKKYNNENKSILNNNIINYEETSSKIIIPPRNSTFQDNEIKDFVLVLVDQYNNEGIGFHYLLNKNSNQSPNKKNQQEDEKNTNKTKTQEDSIKQEKEKIKKEQKERQEKLEKERKEKEKQDKEKEKEVQKEKPITPPFGLPNFGNTCYFNSINQIFLNLSPLQKLFASPKFKFFINRNNKFGHKGKFIYQFLALYKIQPSKISENLLNLKNLVGKLNETFNNRLQQDANEYLHFLLEALHEEMNLKSEKKYIEEKDENYKYNTEDELGKISWANNLRRDTSFIDSIFKFQLKSNLTCRTCLTKKVNFETNYVFDLPLSLCKMVTVEINLYRLPFRYKIYYAKINEKFLKYINDEENSKKNISENLWNFYTDIMTIDEKNNQNIKMHFEFDLEREKKMKDITKILRKIMLLELEPDIEEKDNENKENEIKEKKIERLTELITYSYDNKKIIKPDTIIDKFVNINDKIVLDVFEVLNTNGLKLINENLKNSNTKIYFYDFLEQKSKISNNSSTNNINTSNNKKDFSLTEKQKLIFQLYKNSNNKTNLSDSNSTTSSTSEASTESEVVQNEKENQKETKILSVNDKLLYYSTELPPSTTTSISAPTSPANVKNNKNKPTTPTLPPNNTNNTNIININSTFRYLQQIHTEFLIPIVHYHRIAQSTNTSFFWNNYHSQIYSFPLQYIVFNTSKSNISSRFLYDYIWTFNSLYFNHPNKKSDSFWWKKHNSNNNNNNNNKIKKCYPFVIRFIKFDNSNRNYSFRFHCAKCPWYNFCNGCIIYPDDNPLNFNFGVDKNKYNFNFTILVDWCNSFIQEEFESYNFKTKEISSQIIKEYLEAVSSNDKSYQSIYDCFDLFFEKENLEDPLYCRECGGPMNFIKSYEINKLPHVLILSLKRFKFNENNNFKLRQLITYPIYDFELKNKKYDLYGVVNHYGGIDSGHYTSIVRYKEKEWVMCDDNRVYIIPEARVMNSNAYILFYISKDSIYESNYFKAMKSIMDHIMINNEKKNEAKLLEDLNYFEGEPVSTEYGEGYVIKDFIEDFVIPDKENENKEEKKEETKEEVKEDKKVETKEKEPEPKLIEIKFNFGKGKINRKKVKKQINLNCS